MLDQYQSAARGIVSGLLSALAAFGSLNIAVFTMINIGLDSSWEAALGEAAVRGEHFGRNIIFTCGPLSSLYTRYFDSIEWPLVLAAGVVICASLAWSCSRLASTWFVALLLPTIIFVTESDAILIGVPALSALAVVASSDAPIVLVILATTATASILLAKFSVAPIAVVSFIAIDLSLLRRRVPPIGMGLFLAFVGAWFVAAGQELRDLPDFIKFSFETSSGYSAAMNLQGDAAELLLFIVLSTMFTITVGFEIIIQRAKTFSVALWSVVIASFAFITFKAGFVRPVGHTTISWSGLAIVAVAAASVARSKISATLLAGISILSAGAVLTNGLTNTPSLTVVRNHAQNIRQGFIEVAEIITTPSTWVARQHKAMEQAMANVRAKKSLPDFSGSVDILPSMQSAVIAAGLDYRPRFTIQDYTSYTGALIEKNRESWFGSSAPDHILFGLMPIDNRYPALSEGPLWPELLRFYAPVKKADDLIVLDKRPTPLPEIVGAPEGRNASLGERIVLPAGVLFVSIDIRFNWLGRLLTFVFRSPTVSLRLEYADGRETLYRLIPEITKSGFVISPTIVTADEYAALAMGEMASFGPSTKPVAARIEVGARASKAFVRDAKIIFQRIDTRILKDGRVEIPASAQ